MKLADFFIQLGVKGDTKELDKTIKQLEEAERATKRQIKFQQDLAKATSEEQKALIRKNYYQNKALDLAKKEKNAIVDKNKAFANTVKGITAIGASAVIAYKVIDRMINSLAVANSRMIAFQRQTGISFASLNKYASASASVNFNATPEQMANTMQTLASNLYDIRMGRGDISPYQELAFVGGKPFNPIGMSVDELIESVREAIKDVGDVQATNLITRMGFSPDDLLMLRMTRQEIEQINDLFLKEGEREDLQKYSLQIKKMRLEMQLMKDRALLAIMPAFIKITNVVKNFGTVWGKVLTDFTEFLNKSFSINDGLKLLAVSFAVILKAVSPLTRTITMLYLILEDLAYWYAGKGSVFGDIFGQRGQSEAEKGENRSWFGKTLIGLPKLGYELRGKLNKGEITKEEAKNIALDYLGLGNSANITPPTSQSYMTPVNTNNNVNQNFSIYTTESASVVENSLNFTPIQRQVGATAY